MRIRLVNPFLAMLLASTSIAAQAPDTLFYSVVFSAKSIQGSQKSWRDNDGTHFIYEFNDRGRGPKIREDVKLDQDGLPSVISVRGNNYFKAQVEEKFSVENGNALWNSLAEHGSIPYNRSFYLSFDGVPGEFALLASSLVRSSTHRLTLLPAGEARIESAGERTLKNGSNSVAVTQYLVSGIDFVPIPVWLDKDGNLFASGSTWSMTIRKGWESFIPELSKAQDSVASKTSERLASELKRKPATPVVFRNARLFDADAGVMRDNMSVVVTGNHITAVGSTAQVTAPANAEIVDVKGKTLMPGLWDMHVHTADADGLHNIAAGITTVRDLANDTDELLQRRKRFDEGSLVGPRIIMAGIIDGTGPLAGPTKVLVDNEEQARAAVNKYADLGYVQIKVYSSVKPELVPAIIDAAHKRKLRVSGHVPAFMTADQFVRLGADEMQHMNFVFLNFWGDSIKDTRSPVRFTAVAERGASLDLTSKKVRDFIALLKDRHTVVDPTLNIFEEMFASRPGVMAPGWEGVADRLPPVVRRSLLSGGLPVPDGKDSVYRASFAAMLKMVKALYDAGVTIVPGTDALAGLALQRELELYSEAGIPNADVLRMATIGSAHVMSMDDKLGSIKPGKLADLIIVDGDPVKNMKDVRRVELTMKDGVIYETARVYRALGMQPVPSR